MLMIRFQRIGRTNDPAFRIVVLEKERAAQAGAIVEQLGTYNPRSKALTLKEDRVKEWIKNGAQPTDSIHNLLVSKGIIAGKKVNVLPKKTPVVSSETVAPAETPSTVPVASQPATSDTESLPTEEEVVQESLPSSDESEPAPQVTPAE